LCVMPPLFGEPEPGDSDGEREWVGGICGVTKDDESTDDAVGCM
jgi:hypothetical protein